MSHSPAPRRTAAEGFTLIEVLVALAVIATALSSMGALIAVTIRGTHATERHLARLETARAVATALPDRDQLVLGNLTGELAGHQWRIDVTPFAHNDAGTRQLPPWVPQTVVVTVRSPGGGILQIDTVRLHRRTGG